MKGFEICINDAAPIVAMTDSLVTLIISVGYAEYYKLKKKLEEEGKL